MLKKKKKKKKKKKSKKKKKGKGGGGGGMAFNQINIATRKSASCVATVLIASRVLFWLKALFTNLL